VGGTWHIVSPRLKKWGDTRPPYPPPNCAHEGPSRGPTKNLGAMARPDPLKTVTTAYLRYSRICHILQAIVNRPIWFVSKFR